jgi:hypothetical protein
LNGSGRTQSAIQFTLLQLSFLLAGTYWNV